MTKEQILAVRNKIKEQTKEWAIANGYTDGKDALSPLGSKLQGILNTSDFGCHTQAVVSVLSAISGDVLAPKGNGSLRGGRLVAVVPLTNPNGHTYPIGLPMLSTADSTATSWEGAQRYKPDGMFGNSPCNTKTANRPAMNAEIDLMPEVQIVAAASAVLFI